LTFWDRECKEGKCGKNLFFGMLPGGKIGKDLFPFLDHKKIIVRTIHRKKKNPAGTGL